MSDMSDEEKKKKKEFEKVMRYYDFWDTFYDVLDCIKLSLPVTIPILFYVYCCYKGLF